MGDVGVSERTIYTWIHQYAWDKLKRAAYQAPATISENLCCELIELQNAIARRQPGMRYPTPQEAEVIRKLIGSIERMKKYPSLSQNMQMLETFKNYMRPIDKEFARELVHLYRAFPSWQKRQRLCTLPDGIRHRAGCPHHAALR